MSESYDPLPVAGYTKQSPAYVEAVNRNKRMEERILRLLDTMATYDDIDKRWLAIGRTNIEQGFMAINRSIFKPQRVEGELPPFGE